MLQLCPDLLLELGDLLLTTMSIMDKNVFHSEVLNVGMAFQLRKQSSSVKASKCRSLPRPMNLRTILTVLYYYFQILDII